MWGRKKSVCVNFVATGQLVLAMISYTFTNSHIESQTRLLHWLFLGNNETCSLWQITTNYAERIISPHSMQLNPMRGLLSLKIFCLTAIEAHHPDLRLVDSCECQNRDENHLSQTLAHCKNYKAYQINCISYVIERNRIFMLIFYQQNHEKYTCSELWPS